MGSSSRICRPKPPRSPLVRGEALEADAPRACSLDGPDHLSRPHGYSPYRSIYYTLFLKIMNKFFHPFQVGSSSSGGGFQSEPARIGWGEQSEPPTQSVERSRRNVEVRKLTPSLRATLIPFPNRPCLCRLRLAVPQHCLRLVFVVRTIWKWNNTVSRGRPARKNAESPRNWV